MTKKFVSFTDYVYICNRFRIGVAQAQAGVHRKRKLRNKYLLIKIQNAYEENFYSSCNGRYGY